MKYENMVIYPKKVYLQDLKHIFLIILRNFDFECYGQTFVKAELVMFRLFLMKMRIF